MDFKYFENADKFVGLKEKESICDCCGERKACFDAELFRGKDVRRFNYQALFPNACRNKNG